MNHRSVSIFLWQWISARLRIERITAIGTVHAIQISTEMMLVMFDNNSMAVPRLFLRPKTHGIGRECVCLYSLFCPYSSVWIYWKKEDNIVSRWSHITFHFILIVTQMFKVKWRRFHCDSLDEYSFFLTFPKWAGFCYEIWLMQAFPPSKMLNEILCICCRKYHNSFALSWQQCHQYSRSFKISNSISWCKYFIKMCLSLCVCNKHILW